MAEQQIRKGSKEDVYISGRNRHTPGATVTIASASFSVNNADGTEVQASASATITDNSTLTPDISGLVDTTASGFVAASWYEVIFVVTIGNEEPHPGVWVECVEKRL